MRSDSNVAMQVGSDYFDLSPGLLGCSTNYEADYAEYDVFDSKYPLYVLRGYKGEFEIKGWLMDDPVRKYVSRDAAAEALFCITDKRGGYFGPVGYANLASQEIVDEDGAFALNGKQTGTRKSGLMPQWEYGALFTRNVNQSASISQYLAPVVGQLAMINIVKQGGLTALSLTYSRASRNYSLAADGGAKPQLKVGRLATGGNRTIPSGDISGGSWQLSVSGNRSGAEFYVGIML